MVPPDLKDLNDIEMFKSEIRKWELVSVFNIFIYLWKRVKCVNSKIYIYIYIYIIYIYIYIYVIMKTMCSPGYHQNGFVATHALGHMMYGYATKPLWW